MSQLIESSQESAVRVRYAKAAQAKENALCCPVDYDQRFLKAIPNEVIERDYGCGDPSRYLEKGETVLDLGSGTGKICFIASQVVGPKGRVIGVDMTDDMLEVARRNAPVVSENIGYSNVEFRKGRIQDLRLDMEALDSLIESSPVVDSNGLMELEAKIEQLREDHPMIDDDSIDVVVSNCVLNLVDADKKKTLFRELHRVLKDGGRAVISDIVSDEPVTSEMMRDPELWSGCLSGAMTESAFLQAFEDAGFYGIRYRKFDLSPWRVVDGVVFRSVTVEAFKASHGEEKDLNQAAIYNGPFSRVVDDEGIVLERGVRIAVSDRQSERYQRSPYKESITMVPPSTGLVPEEAPAFDKDAASKLRMPIESKGPVYAVKNGSPESCCSEESSCC